MKKCCMCKEKLSDNAFHKNKASYDGLQSYCKTCFKEWKQKSPRWKNTRHKNYLKRKEISHKLLKELKINGCAICGYDKNYAALEFHHVNPEDKKYCVAFRLMDYPDKTILKELNKCVLLCANCHREIHNKEVK